MLSLGFSEMLVVGIVLLIAVGPERLPHVTRTLGRMYGQIRRAADELRRALVIEADRMDEKERLVELRRRRMEAERERKARDAAVAEGAASQQAPGDGGAASDVPAPPPEGSPPPGFTQAEWDELPEHVKQIVHRRGSAS
jgi:sec-independent protein translocase protein TatB